MLAAVASLRAVEYNSRVKLLAIDSRLCPELFAYPIHQTAIGVWNAIKRRI